MKVYNRIIDLISWLVSKFLAVLLVSLVLVVFANIILRYIGHSIRWADEVARLLFVWTAFLGMFFAYNRNLHPSFTLVMKIVGNNKPIRGKAMMILVHALVLAFLTIVLYGGIVYIGLAKIQTTAVLRMSVGWMYAAAPVGVFLMILETIKKLFLLIGGENFVKLLEGSDEIEVGKQI